jgi:hypothetical protein
MDKIEVTFSEIMEYMRGVEKTFKQGDFSCSICIYGDGSWIIFTFMHRALMSGSREELAERIAKTKRGGGNVESNNK